MPPVHFPESSDRRSGWVPRTAQTVLRSPRMDDPKHLVAAGYDAMAARLEEWQRQIVGSPRIRYLDQLLALLPPHPDLLELGCGAGVESTRVLAEHGRLTGVDISEAQLALARQRIPAATFIRAALAELRFAAARSAGVVGA